MMLKIKRLIKYELLIDLICSWITYSLMHRLSIIKKMFFITAQCIEQDTCDCTRPCADEKTWEQVSLLNPLTPRVKPWVIQSFLTFDSMYRLLKCDHSLESC